MSLTRKVFSLTISGALVGALLGVAAPPAALSASEGCKCDDTGSGGSYQCNKEQTKCIAGHEKCTTVCAEE